MNGKQSVSVADGAVMKNWMTAVKLFTPARHVIDSIQTPVSVPYMRTGM